MFLRDLAEVAGYTGRGRNRRREPSLYVLRRPVLTAPDPWFFAGLVALESAAICSLFPPANASELLRHIADQADAAINDEGRVVAKVVFALMGRLGYGAVLMRMPIPMKDIANVLLLMVGGLRSWTHLLPNAKAHRQIRAALKTGAPSWWRAFARTQPLA